MNLVVLLGRAVKDPEARQGVATFTLAVDRMKEGTDFIRIVTFGKTAEIVLKYVQKGKQVAIQGRINTGSYEKDGKKVYTTDVIADRLTLLGSKEKSEQQTFEGFQALGDDDVPF